MVKGEEKLGGRSNRNEKDGITLVLKQHVLKNKQQYVMKEIPT